MYIHTYIAQFISIYFIKHINIYVATVILVCMKLGLPRWHSGKESAYQCRRLGFDSWVGKIPWSRKWQPTPVFLPGKSHGHRNLAGYSSWVTKSQT